MTITSDASAPLVVVGGATGQQGGSVVRALQESDKAYRIRGLTRDVSKPAAKALAEQGVEMLSANLAIENKAQVLAAYEGAAIVFAMTNFWEHFDKEQELTEGKMVIDAALGAKVPLFIFSSLGSIAEHSGGKYKNVHHFESKAQIANYGRSKASPSFTFVAVQAGFYYSNLTGNQIIRPQGDGTWAAALPCKPDALVPGFDVDEYGLWVRAVIEHEELRDGRELLTCCSQEMSIGDMVDEVAKQTGLNIVFKTVSNDEFRRTLPEGTPEHVKDDLVEIWNAVSEFGLNYNREDVTRLLPYLNRKPTTFADWVRKRDMPEYGKRGLMS
ncbi:hypothetical protein NLJ89_g10407 [Agrocybe chaxingu]|uniref:NmrA-like domain-containing protein n=1 Tax=Agrocybe chaxingu TaxID=84603 RepID=A0A9W8JY80_9AGAR|nr:hypothetical protein NLJ89_g10407 [Agrocybe chaxingu]